MSWTCLARQLTGLFPLAEEEKKKKAIAVSECNGHADSDKRIEGTYGSLIWRVLLLFYFLASSVWFWCQHWNCLLLFSETNQTARVTAHTSKNVNGSIWPSANLKNRWQRRIIFIHWNISSFWSREEVELKSLQVFNMTDCQESTKREQRLPLPPPPAFFLLPISS